jgi:hypothetical protein
MQKKLLVTVSDEISYLHGVRFVGSFFMNKQAVSVTLFYVAPRADIAGGGQGAGRHEIDKQAAEASRKKGHAALDAARKMLLDRGFPVENITSQFIYRQFGTIKDIIREARSGQYDAVILGRRGYMIFESVFGMSMTKEILDQNIETPIWICRNPEESRRNVLLCVDGSDSSLRMVDHAGFMLKDENEHSVTLFHVDSGEGQDREAIFNEARKVLLDNWISNGRVKSVASASTVTNVAKTILDEAQAGAYAVVGVGRAGIHKGRLKEWLVGSRTMKVLETIEKASLWVSS